jgi:hypothetical protein
VVLFAQHNSGNFRHETTCNAVSPEGRSLLPHGGWHCSSARCHSHSQMTLASKMAKLRGSFVKSGLCKTPARRCDQKPPTSEAMAPGGRIVLLVKSTMGSLKPTHGVLAVSIPSQSRRISHGQEKQHPESVSLSGMVRTTPANRTDAQDGYSRMRSTRLRELFCHHHCW